MSGIRFLGVDDNLKADHERFSRRQEKAIGLSLRSQAEMVMTESKARYVPVDKGLLRASGIVEGPYQEGDVIFVDMGYGGPAAPYAVVVHEDMAARHTVGQAKYLEIPALSWADRLPNVLVRAAKGAA